MKTVSLGLAKSLREKGFPQQCEHWWGGIGNMGIWCDHVKEELPAQESRFTWIAAPTAEEVLEQLPKRLPYEVGLVYLEIYPLTSREGWLVQYVTKRNEIIYTPYAVESEKTLAEAAGKMYIFLKEQELL